MFGQLSDRQGHLLMEKDTMDNFFCQRLWVFIVAACLATCALGQSVDDYPQRPVKIIVPFAPGGATDVVARMVASAMTSRTSQTFMVENKAGSANIMGNDAVAKAKPDGYTLLFAAAPLALNSALGMKLPYELATDFAPISLVASAPMLIAVHPDTPWRSLSDVVAAARSQAGGLSYATAGVGSMPHLLGESLRSSTGVSLVHVGYKGAAPALQDAVAGVVPILIDAYVPSGAQVLAGRLRALAIAAPVRSAVLPDVPTTAEQGFPTLVGAGFYGLLAPAGTPPSIITKLHATLLQAMQQSDLRARLIAQGYSVHVSTPSEYASYLKNEITRWTPVVKAAGIKPE
jgi:tripartite-type tricarboxylate transporter receptor subunit TctC